MLKMCSSLLVATVRSPSTPTTCNKVLRTVSSSSSASSSFKSDIHTDRLYPGTTSDDRFKAVSHSEPADSDSLRFSGHIPVSELEIRATSGASGPGGQNVNKSPTKVEIRFNLQKASWLTDSMKKVLTDKWSRSQLTKEGDFVVKSDRTRSMQLNQADAMAKLRHAIRSELEGALTRLREQQVTQEEAELERKRAQRAAALRLKQKRDKSIKTQIRKDRNPMGL